MDKRIRVVLVEAGKPPYVKTIRNSIESLQKAVGGDIQMLGLSVGETLVCQGQFKNVQKRALNFVQKGRFTL